MSAAALFWSEQGEVACADHAPYPKSDTWNRDRWSKMTASARLEWVAEVGSPAQCECPTCPTRKAVQS